MASIDDTPMSPKFLGRALLKGAVQRVMFDPYTKQVLDVRRAVLVDGTDRGLGSHVMTADNWEKARETFFAKFGEENFSVYDGRVLFS